MKIILVDDHELVRTGISRIIMEEFPSAEIQLVSTGLQAEKLVRTEKTDLLIMDISLPDKTGLDVLKQLRFESVKIPILILSIHPESQYAIRVLKAGGNGYITKASPRADFINAVKTIINGKKYISPEVTERLASRFDDTTNKELHELISDRELQVLKLISSGKTATEIANELSLSIATISTYRQRLLEKLGLKNNAELMYYAINNHLF